MSYKLVKNTEWKEVEINEKIKRIPNDWNFEKISQNINFTMGNTPKKENDNYNGDLPWITISNFDSKYILQYSANIKKLKNVKILPKGTLLGSFKMSVGKFAFTTEDCATNEAIIAIKENDTIHDLDFLYYILPKYFIKNAEQNGQGLLLLNSKKINDIDILLPKKEYQVSISSILSKQESIISNIEKLIEKNEIIFNELSEQLLSGKLRLKDENGSLSIYKNPDDNWKEVEVNGKMKNIPSDWHIEQVENCVVMEKNTKKSQINTTEIKNIGKLPVISQEVKFISGFIDDITPLSASKNDPTIIFGDHSCTLKLVEFNYVLGGDGTKVFKAKEDTKFLYYSIRNLKLNTEGYKRHYPILKEMFVNLPPKYEQELLSKFFNNNVNKIEKLKALLLKEKEKFEWLLDNLLSGNYLVKEIEK